MKKVLLAAVLMGITLTACNENKQTTNEEGMNTTLQLTQEWDKVFPQSDKVTHEKVTLKLKKLMELKKLRSLLQSPSAVPSAP